MAKKTPAIISSDEQSAFVSEDIPNDDLPDRPISKHPNSVTEQGLALIEPALETARVNSRRLGFTIRGRRKGFFGLKIAAREKRSAPGRGG